MSFIQIRSIYIQNKGNNNYYYCCSYYNDQLISIRGGVDRYDIISRSRSQEHLVRVEGEAGHRADPLSQETVVIPKKHKVIIKQKNIL